jgi:hypothetical protein
MRQSNRWLIVGTWESSRAEGHIVTWAFRRNGQFTQTVRLPGHTAGPQSTDCGSYRVDGLRLTIKVRGLPPFIGKLVRLDGRVLVLSYEPGRNVYTYRRR